MTATSCALSEPTLVLNRAWIAIRSTSVREALRLLFTGAARAVDPETYEVHGFESWSELAVAEGQSHVRTVSLRIPAPEVIVLTRYAGMPNPKVPFTRRNLFRRDNNMCQYCGVRPGVPELSIDHVQPRSMGGPTSWQNCVLACVRCNHRKANRTPAQARMTLRREPKAPKWSPTLTIPVGRRRQSWSKFVGEQYWNTPLV